MGGYMQAITPFLHKDLSIMDFGIWGAVPFGPEAVPLDNEGWLYTWSSVILSI